MVSNRDEPVSFMTQTSSSPIPVLDPDANYLLDPNSQIGSASNSFQGEGLLVADSGNNSDVEFGFLRSEFRQNLLVGTVDKYDRHVFLCYKNPTVWPPHIEAAEFDRLPRLLSAAMNARKPEMKKQTQLTICEGHDGTETSNGDVLIFPNMIRYRRLTHFDVDTFVEEVLVKDGEWLPGTPEMLKGSYIFVCSHASRDRRCGVCGPSIISRIREEIEACGLQGRVSVSPCSHVGGSKYACNVIIFGSNVNGETSGHWYGYVTPDDVPMLLEQHIGKGEIIDWLWRGQMGLSDEEQKKCVELRLQVKGGNNVGKNTKEASDMSISVNESHMDNAACCQANGDSACCQNDGLTSKMMDKHDPSEVDTKVTAEKTMRTKKQVSSRNSSKGGSSRKVCSMPTWFESWEREDTYAAVSVLCAAVSVAIAYHCYKQLR
ncbi:Thioredoxin-like ferredoxin [Dillenia turbinata]|uniref:Thioredoxin-like ferredoxin n=1 Tax=Dillenia turbinata TaxID=194707 RepID=A0AAN8ZHW7_9MAGN